MGATVCIVASRQQFYQNENTERVRGTVCRVLARDASN